MSYSMFDHEQQIMKCWNVVDDLRALNAAILETDITRDKISNILMGMADLYDVKFDTLFNQFEQSIEEKNND